MVCFCMMRVCSSEDDSVVFCVLSNVYKHRGVILLDEIRPFRPENEALVNHANLFVFCLFVFFFGGGGGGGDVGI